MKIVTLLLNFDIVKISFFCFRRYHLKRNLDKLQQGVMHINIDSVIFNNRKRRLCGKRPKERSTVYTSNNSLLLQNAGSPKEFKFWQTHFTYYVCHAKHGKVSLTPLY